MNEFTERYQQMSNHNLLEIISNAEDYQTLAVETAQKEIETRSLTVKELDKAFSTIDDKRKVEQRNIEIRKGKEEHLKASFIRLFDPINPFLHGIPFFERSIRLITIIFGLLSIYQLFVNFDSFQSIFKSTQKWYFSILVFLIPYLMFPFSVYLFWKRKRIGWVLLNMYFTYSLINLLILVYYAIIYQPSLASQIFL